MRKTIKYLIAILTIAILHGCYREELFPVLVQEGTPVRMKLNYASSEGTVKTRSAASEENENSIDNIYLFVFNSSGDKQPLLTDGEKLRGSNLFTTSKNLTPETNSSGYLSFACGSLTNATIVAIANVNVGNTYTAYDIDTNVLNKIETLEQLKSTIMQLNPKSIGRGAKFMMTGFAEDGEGNNVIDITGTIEESGIIDINCMLKLRRTDAKVEVTVTSDGTGKQDFSFRPTSWRVVQVPSRSFILPSDEGTDAGGDNDTYFSTNAEEFEELTQDVVAGGGSIANSYTGSFVFYMPENLKTPENTIDNSSALSKEEKYALREQWVTEGEKSDPSKPGYVEDNIGFHYAPENSTYLEITGRLSYNDGQTVVSSTSTYYVHLGGFVDGKNDLDPNDYKTKRNYYYKYTITVKGINDIAVEVSAEGDPRPGHEGDVVYSERGFYDLDCHYERKLISIPRSAMTKDNGNTDLWWGVSTPFSNGVHKVGDPIPVNMRDYRWIKFAVNKLYGVLGERMVKYPGDQNYNEPYPQNGWTEGVNYNAESPYEPYSNYNTARLMDVDQLLKYLKVEANKTDGGIFGNDESIYVTAFVDEYLYVCNPVPEDNEKPNQEPQIWWKRSVNQADRMMHIILENAKYSSDGKSSVVNSMYTFNQKSIRTFYNTASAVPSGWGIESVMETDRLPVDEDMDVARSTSNGRWNTWTYFKEKHKEWDGGWWGEWVYNDFLWTDILNTTAEHELNEDYNNVFYACLMRNRDINGDNIVQENEVRWYLAAIDQLSDMYIGEYALDYESRLYPYDPLRYQFPPNNGDGIKWHYASSTYDSRKNGPNIIWAEEGTSKGNYGDDQIGNNYAYRCIRNLGLSIDNINGEPEDFVQFTPQSDGTYIFNLEYLDPKALRDYYVPGAGELRPHNETDSDNLPWVKFKLTSGTRGIGGGVATWETYQNSNPWVSDHYRLPNLREMLIFSSRIDLPLTDRSYPYIMSCTSFSLCNSPWFDSIRKGYSYNTDDGSIGPHNHSGYVYGVTDLNE